MAQIRRGLASKVAAVARAEIFALPLLYLLFAICYLLFLLCFHSQPLFWPEDAPAGWDGTKDSCLSIGKESGWRFGSAN
jgi:hypothetical protein